MGECIILRQGTRFFGDDYTATASDVLTGKNFLGNGSDELQAGTKKNITPEDVTLPINGTYSIVAGYHNATQKVTQNIKTQAATTVTPTGKEQTVSISGKYMSGDVTISAISNYAAEYIKKGVTVGTGDQAITGTYEGFE